MVRNIAVDLVPQFDQITDPLLLCRRNAINGVNHIQCIIRLRLGQHQCQNGQ